MPGPVQDARETYSAEESLKMMTAVRKIVATTPAASGDIDLNNAWRSTNGMPAPTSLVNLTANGGLIVYRLASDPTTDISEFFAAGQEKLRRVVYLTQAGTAVTSIGVCQT